MRSKEEIEKLLACFAAALEEPTKDADSVDTAMMIVAVDLLLWILGGDSPFVAKLFRRFRKWTGSSA